MVHSAPGVNLSLVSPFDLSKMLQVASEGHPSKVEPTRNGKLRITCEDNTQYNHVKALKKIDKYNVNIEIPLVRAPLSYVLIFGISPEVSCEDLKNQIDCAPEVVYRLKRDGAQTTTVKLGYKGDPPGLVHIGYMSSNLGMVSLKPAQDWMNKYKNN